MLNKKEIRIINININKVTAGLFLLELSKQRNLFSEVTNPSTVELNIFQFEK